MSTKRIKKAYVIISKSGYRYGAFPFTADGKKKAKSYLHVLNQEESVALKAKKRISYKIVTV